MDWQQIKLSLIRHQELLQNIGLWILWIGLAIMVRVFLIQPFNIPSRSMVPTLLVGDHLFVSKYAYGYSRYSFPFQSGNVSSKIFSTIPQRGDVVVFRPPLDNSQDYIKRVIGLPGDRVQMKESILHINGAPVARKYLRNLGNHIYQETLPNGKTFLTRDITKNGESDNTKIYKVPPEHIFVMGDNRDNSQDSRFYTIGFIPLNNLIGRAEIIYFSLGQSGEPDTFLFGIRLKRLVDVIE